MEFALPDAVAAIRRRLVAFMDAPVYPNEPAFEARLAAFWADSRTLRFADGPDEVHRNQIGRLELREH